MDTLEISTLGGLDIRRGRAPVSGFASRKVEALLVYLACRERPQPREVLANLLWEEHSQSRALANLRDALSNLRKLLGPYVTITRNTAALNPEAQVLLDTARLESNLGPVTDSISARRVEGAVALYRGDFLEGFFVRGARNFEAWATRERERMHQLVVEGLTDLVFYALRMGAFWDGTAHASRLLTLDPLNEAAHRQMMMLLAYNGQRGAALAQFESCRQVLEEELGVEPAAETIELYGEIERDELRPAIPRRIPVEGIEPLPPAWLMDVREREEVPRPAFVCRERQIDRLNSFLAAAISGEGQTAFVTGGAGRGKTALLDAFGQSAAADNPDLLVARGYCNAFAGAGDPYLPFRHLLGVLTGDVELHWASGLVDGESAARLWNAMPSVIQALVDCGPDLIGLLIPGAPLVSRLEEALPGTALVARLKELVGRDAHFPANTEQSQLFEQVCLALRTLSTSYPLLLLLDDIQWVDATSAELLFHLGRGLAGSRILIVGAYRPEEVAIGRDGGRHPLEKTLAELKRFYGDIWVDLGAAEAVEGRAFVDAFLDTEPNSLGESFRRALADHAGGHPLFTVELLRALQERGDLVQDDAGRWVEGAALDWTTMPARVEGVIEERIGRLDAELQEILMVASVEGQEFTAQVVARVGEIGERQLIRRLSSELERQHRLVAVQGIRRLGRQRLFLYRFEHNLFQSYLYDMLDEVLRATLHEDVGFALEALHGDQADAIAVQLARHFALAGMDEKAAIYLQRAGEQAAARFANHQAVDYYRQALELSPAIGQADQFTLHFGLGRVLAHMGEYDLAVEHLEKVYSSFESVGGQDTILTRARACYHIGRIYERRGGVEGLEAALAWQHKGLALLPKAPTAEAALLYALGGIVGIRQLDLERADRECELSLSLARAANSKPEMALSHRLLSISLRAQGRLEEAMAHCNSSITICEELTDLMGLATNLSNRGVIAWEMDDWSSAQESYREALAIQEQIGDRYQLAMTSCNLADAHSHLGNLEAGIACATRGLEVYSAIEAPQGVIFARVVMGILFCRMGAFENARDQLLKARRLSEAQDDVEFKTTIGRWLAETYLAAGNLDAAEAEVCWLRALGADELGSEVESVERLWGRILAKKGRLADGQKVLKDSLARQEGRGGRYELGRTLLALGELLAQMDGDAAKGHLERARAIFADLGAASDTQEVDELLVRL